MATYKPNISTYSGAPSPDVFAQAGGADLASMEANVAKKMRRGQGRTPGWRAGGLAKMPGLRGRRRQNNQLGPGQVTGNV